MCEVIKVLYNLVSVGHIRVDQLQAELQYALPYLLLPNKKIRVQLVELVYLLSPYTQMGKAKLVKREAFFCYVFPCLKPYMKVQDPQLELAFNSRENITACLVSPVPMR